jgi:hypothetical protein
VERAREYQREIIDQTPNRNGYLDTIIECVYDGLLKITTMFNSINNKGKLVFDFICNVIAWLAWVLENSIEWTFYFLTHDWFFHVVVMILSLALITFLINNVYPPIGILIKRVKNFGRRRFSRRQYQRSNRFLD